MTVRDDFRVYFARLDDKTWVAASNEEPFFCFTGATEQEVGNAAVRALDFYDLARKDAPAPVLKSETVRVSTFARGKVRTKKELEAA